MVAHWGADQDIFGLYREGGFIEVQVLLVRQGKLTDNLSYSLQDLEFPDEEIVGSLLTQFYQGQRFIPDEILLPVELEDREAREEYLSERKGKTDRAFIAPQRGDKRHLVDDGARECQAELHRAARSGEGPRENAARVASAAALEALPAAHRVLRYLDDPRRQRGRLAWLRSSTANPTKISTVIIEFAPSIRPAVATISA